MDSRSENQGGMRVALSRQRGPVYLEGRLVLSLSFADVQEGGRAPAVGEDGVPAETAALDGSLPNAGELLEVWRIWDDAEGTWYHSPLEVSRFEEVDVVTRRGEGDGRFAWTGAVDTHARIILVPDLDEEGSATNAPFDLCWRLVGQGPADATASCRRGSLQA